MKTFTLAPDNLEQAKTFVGNQMFAIKVFYAYLTETGSSPCIDDAKMESSTFFDTEFAKTLASDHAQIILI